MYKIFLSVFCIFVSFSATAAPANLCDAQNKLDFSLEQKIVEATSAGLDLGTVFILGIVKTTKNIDPDNLLKLLEVVQDERTQIRAVFPMANTNIVTFSSSLAGVINAACSDDVISIQMSQELPE